jgi:hypothetical protein
VHYLELGSSPPTEPGTWAATAAAAGGYAPVNGVCPNGTVGLYGSKLSFNDGSGFYHYAFATGSGWSSGGWSTFALAACVFPPSGTDGPPLIVPGNPATVGVYSNTIDNTDWSWTPGSGTNVLQWYETRSFS